MGGFRATYGYRRVWAMVNRTFRVGYNRKRVRRLMRMRGLGEQQRQGGGSKDRGHQDPGSDHRFPGEIYQAPRSWAERANPHLLYFDEVDKGGHFAAWEEPELFAVEQRAA